MNWDPGQYLRYAGERSRPFADLLARVRVAAPKRVADLGCGPGNLTRTLLERWPLAEVVGVDSSAQMIAAARAASGAGAGDVAPQFIQADLRTWEPSAPLDLLVSNATLQWIPEHLAQLPRLADLLAPGGWMAFQLPGNFDEPSHVLLHQLADSDGWRTLLGGTDVKRPAAHSPTTYLTSLAALGMVVDAWETTYFHVLHGDDPVLEWMKGTGARPVLAALGDADRSRFLAEYATLLRAAYPKQGFGTVLPYRRIFVVAHT